MNKAADAIIGRPTALWSSSGSTSSVVVMANKRRAPRGTTVTVVAKPGSARDAVRVLVADGTRPTVEVRVRAKAVDGAANKAILEVLAAALGVRRSAVTILRGEHGRTKHVQVDAAPDSVWSALARLRG